MVTELTNDSFKDFLAKNDLVIVDFWAEWCVDPETKILTENNILKQAQEISSGDGLITYSGKELISDNVKKSFTSDKLGHCRKIITKTNRSIKVTDEHELFTPEGWKKAIELKGGDKVAILPKYFSEEEIVEVKTILEEKNIKGVSEEGMRVDRYIQELKTKDLLPLKTNNPKTRILCKILGAIFTDGNLYSGKNNYREVSFSLGTKKDIENLSKDLKELGFEKFQIRKQEKLIEVNGRSYTIRVHKLKLNATSLWLILKALGAPVGDKTNQEYNLPEWLIRTKNKILKKEFLAAYLGGDGPKINIHLTEKEKKNAFNSLSLNDIEFHKSPEAENSGILLAKQLKDLFGEFGIIIRKIFVEEDNYIKRDGKKSKIIHLYFEKNFENAFRLYRNVGYTYAETKDQESMYAAEFLRRVLYQREEWKGVYTKAILLNKQKGFGYRHLSRVLHLHPHTIWQWIKKDVKPTVNKHYLKFNTWVEEQKKSLPVGLVWEPIEAVHEITLKSVQKITMEKNHNFIANGFLAHNCGPCKVMAPVFEEASKEITKMKFAKLNVDEETEIASEYSVMSIPTTIIFHKGRELSRLIGFMPKAVFKSKVNEAIKEI